LAIVHLRRKSLKISLYWILILIKLFGFYKKNERGRKLKRIEKDAKKERRKRGLDVRVQIF